MLASSLCVSALSQPSLGAGLSASPGAPPQLPEHWEEARCWIQALAAGVLVWEVLRPSSQPGQAHFAPSLGTSAPREEPRASSPSSLPFAQSRVNFRRGFTRAAVGGYCCSKLPSSAGCSPNEPQGMQAAPRSQPGLERLLFVPCALSFPFHLFHPVLFHWLQPSSASVPREVDGSLLLPLLLPLPGPQVLIGNGVPQLPPLSLPSGSQRCSCTLQLLPGMCWGCWGDRGCAHMGMLTSAIHQFWLRGAGQVGRHRWSTGADVQGRW